MTNLLLKLFVKNSKDTSNSKVRESVGQMSGLVGIVLNILLATAKIAVGIIFGVLSVLADGLNNFTDCGSNIVSLISLKMANKPADSEHPYGHRRIEYIASMIVAFLVLIVAFELGSESVTKIIDLIKGQSEALEFSIWTVSALGASILVKLWMFFFNRKLGKKYNLDLLKATATDSISDVGATSAVLLAVIVSNFTGFNLDGIMGLLVAVVIAVAGLKILNSTANQLVGEAPDEETIKSIEQRIKNYDGVFGIHDLNVHNYGPNRFYASVHVEVDAAVDVMESHDLMDRIEHDFAENTDIILVTHLDPIVIGDPEVDMYKQEVCQIVHKLDEHYSIHDFRIVKGITHTNLVFDLAVHFDTKMSNSELANYIQTELNNLHSDDHELFVVPTVERQVKDDNPHHDKKHR